MDSKKVKIQKPKHRIGAAVLVGFALSLVLGGPWVAGYILGHGDGFKDGEKATVNNWSEIVRGIVKSDCNRFCKGVNCEKTE